MVHLAFTRVEAQGKVGTQVRSRIAFGSIPKGALGTIVRADEVIDGYDLEVSWVWPGHPTPWVEWVTKGEYDAHLVEVQRPRTRRMPKRPTP